MLEKLENLPAGVDGLIAKGKVTKEDYEQVIHPLLEQARQEGRRLRFLYEFGPGFEGFTAGAAWQDARLGMHYLRLFERCAVITDIRWIREAVHIVGSMMPCPFKEFAIAERAAAIEWLAAPATMGIAHRFLPQKGVLVLEPSGALRREDFDALAAIVDPWIEAHDGLRGIVVHAHAFPGWENLGGLVRHMRFVRDHHRKVHRVALVTDSRAAELAPSLVEHFVAAEVKHFDEAHMDDAVEWAGA